MIFRLRDYIYYPIPIARFRRMLDASQFWDRGKRRAWIQERLERTLWHALQHVPYYRRTLQPYATRFNEMIDRLDLSALPVITKETIRTHYKELHADNYLRYRPTLTHTSGSTGTPAEFVLDKESNVSHFASIWRLLNWTGYRFGQRFADLTGHILEGDRLFDYDMRLNCLRLSSFNFKRENVPFYMERLARFKPVLFKAYPSSLSLLCRWISDCGIEPHRPRAVLTCAESLLSHQEQLIADVLKCPIYDFYNQNERGGLISTCEKGTYHVHEEYSFVEFLAPSDRIPQTPTLREIVTTSFHNRAMPLIRYRTDDLADVGDDQTCECQRTYKTVRSIFGRIEDVVVTPDGRHVGRLDAAFKFSPGIRMSQVIQESPDEIQVLLVKAKAFCQGDVDRIEEELRARVGDVIGIRFRFVDSIPAGKNGKIKFVISRLNSPTRMKHRARDTDTSSIDG